MSSTAVTTVDGHQFTVRSYGTGPGVVVVHGSVVWGRDYVRLALMLAPRLTVHLYDRFGRGERPSLDGVGYSTEREIRDLTAVLERTGARMLIGHSYGGYVAAQAARTLPVDRLALFDPLISIGHNLPADWITPFMSAVAADQPAQAFTIASTGLEVAGLVSRLPSGAQEQIAKALLAIPTGRRWRSSLPVTIAEMREVLAHSSDGTEYGQIVAETWIGEAGNGPEHYRTTCRLLAGLVPGAQLETFANINHSGLILPVPTVAMRMASFLAGESG